MHNNQYYSDAIRDMIKHEGILLNHRFGWFLTSQSILFSALGFSWNKGPEIIQVLVFVGVVINISMLSILQVSITAQKRLEGAWDERCHEDKTLRKVYAPVSGLRDNESNVLVRILFPWISLPLVFLMLWCFLGYKIYL